MFGAIIGDLAGSIYEYDQVKKVHLVNVDKIIEDNSFYSDDTILSVAILDAILHNKDYERFLKLYAKKYINYMPNFTPYFKTIFSPNFTEWVLNKNEGKSTGNGAMMRISAVGYMFDTEEDIIENATNATIPSHNTLESIEAAKKIALIIFYLRKGFTLKEVYNKLNIIPNYKPFEKFNLTCNETINNCLYALYNSNSFKDAIKKTILMGGDTDTNAAIVGSMAEAMYGIDDDLILLAKQRIPKEFIDVLEKGYSLVKKLTL